MVQELFGESRMNDTDLVAEGGPFLEDTEYGDFTPSERASANGPLPGTTYPGGAREKHDATHPLLRLRRDGRVCVGNGHSLGLAGACLLEEAAPAAPVAAVPGAWASIPCRRLTRRRAAGPVVLAAEVPAGRSRCSLAVRMADTHAAPGCLGTTHSRDRPAPCQGLTGMVDSRLRPRPLGATARGDCDGRRSILPVAVLRDLNALRVSSSGQGSLGFRQVRVNSRLPALSRSFGAPSLSLEWPSLRSLSRLSRLSWSRRSLNSLMATAAAPADAMSLSLLLLRFRSRSDTDEDRERSRRLRRRRLLSSSRSS